jgi:penicillin-binding protein 2
LATRSRASEAQDNGAGRWYLLFIMGAFGLLLLRLFSLQVIQHRAHYKASLDNILRSVTIPPPRGTIYDRAGKPLAVSKQTFGLLFTPPRDIDSYLPDEKQRRVISVASINYDYLKRVEWKDSAGKRLRTPLHPRQELIDSTLPGDVRSALSTWRALLPDAEAIATYRDSVQGPLADDLGPVDIAGALGTPQRSSDFRTVSEVVSAYIGSRGLGPDYAKDRQLLADRALDQLHRQMEPPDLPQAASVFPLSPAMQRKLELEQQRKTLDEQRSSTAQTLQALFVDEQTLAALYADKAALSGQETSGWKLAEIQQLAKFLGKPYEELMSRLSSELGKGYGPHPLMIADELTSDQKLYIGEHTREFQNEIIEEYSFKRHYPLGMATTHLLGYLGAASDKQIESGYDPQETSGKLGVERQYEDTLRGQLGRRDMEISRQGVFVAERNVEPPRRGNDMLLSIDSGVQAAAHRIVSQTMAADSRITGGAIIVNALAPENRGEILALVSGPSYDPTRFTEKNYYAIIHDKHNVRKPELNRAIGLAQPPGSTFKIVTLTAALQTGTTTMNSSFYCPGFMTLGRTKQVFHCHERVGGHQGLGTAKALAESCDVAFYQMGLRLPEPAQDTLAAYARYFGYGQPVGIDLPGEVKGAVPDTDWKWTHMRRYGKAEQLWYDGDTANYSIGQGFLQVTPLQDLWSASIVAWDGMRYPSRLVLATKGQHGLERTEQQPGEATQLDPAVLKEVSYSMRQAVKDGTCRKLNFPGLNVCAKTGSAEMGRNKQGHSWVVGFYPQDDPHYGFICFFEHGGESGDAAIPAAVELLKYLKSADPLGRPKTGSKAPSRPAR